MPISHISKELPGLIGNNKATDGPTGHWRGVSLKEVTGQDDADTLPGLAPDAPGAAVPWKRAAPQVIDRDDVDRKLAQDLGATGHTPAALAARRRAALQRAAMKRAALGHPGPPVTIGLHRRPPPPATRTLRDSIPPGAEAQVRLLARDFVRTGRLPRHGAPLGREEATLQYLALRTVEVALRDSDDNKNPRQFLAQMLPLHHTGGGGRQPLGVRGVGRQLRSVRGDLHALKSLLGPIYGERELPRELLDLLDDGESQDNDDALVELLAEDHGLPTLAALRGRRRHLSEQLEDAREDLLHSNEQQVFGSLNAEEASRRTDDPRAFKDNYCEFLHGELGFAGTFRKVVELFGSENLRSTLMTLKKALGDDMNQLSAPTSYAPEHLAAIHNVVSHLSRLSQINVVLETALPLLNLMTQAGVPLDERLLTAGISTLFDTGTPTALRYQSLCESLDLARGGPRIQLMNQLGTIIRQLPASCFADPAGHDAALAGHEALEARRRVFIDAMVNAQEIEQEFEPDVGDPHEQRRETALAELAARAAGSAAPPSAAGRSPSPR